MSVATNTRRTWRFPGGLHMPDHKAMSLGSPIGTAPIPRQLILPLSQHIGAPAIPCVAVGDQVYRGQTVAEADGYVSAPIHASSSGRVVEIGPRLTAHPSGLKTECIVIETDGQDTPLPEPEWAPTPNYSELDPAELRQIVRRAGITGLGGAAFPSFIKLNPGPGSRIETLILNGAECEPYIACDQAVMAERAGEIIAGARLIQYAIGAPQCLIGIEDNKPDAITALQSVVADETGIEVVVLPTRYPQGGEKQLIQALTGKQVPSEGLPLDIGIVCHNVATAAAVWRAVVHAEPLISRVMTITGSAVAQPRNLQVRIGTPVADLIEYCGGYQDIGRLIMGGPMMGFALRSDEVPVVKATNCILAVPQEEIRPEEPAMPCIRCGACADDCPASLLPQQLYWYARDKDFEGAQKYNLFDCIECGVCAQVCPSHIPLVQYFRFAKTEIWKAEREKQQSDIARQRHEARKARLEKEAEEAEARRAAKRNKLSGGAQHEIEQALARAKAKKAATQATQTVESGEPQSAVQAAIARAKAASSAEATESEPAAAGGAAAIIARARSRAEGNQDAQPPQSAAAAAIARARAKGGEAPATKSTGSNSAADIIARARAKKEGGSASPTPTASASAPSASLSPAQQAIARARAASGNDDSPATAAKAAAQPETAAQSDAVVAQAIARARAARGAPVRPALAPGEVPAHPYFYSDSITSAAGGNDVVQQAIDNERRKRADQTTSKPALSPGEVPAPSSEEQP